MRLKSFDNAPDLSEIDARCAELNQLRAKEGNGPLLVWFREIVGKGLLLQARRAISVLFLDQPERIEAYCMLAKASNVYADLFALRGIVREGCVGRQPRPEVVTACQALIAKLSQMQPPRERRRSKKGLVVAEEDDEPEEEPEAQSDEAAVV